MAFDEIKSKLEAAGYRDQFHEADGHKLVIDMHGLAVAETSQVISEPHYGVGRCADPLPPARRAMLTNRGISTNQ